MDHFSANLHRPSKAQGQLMACFDSQIASRKLFLSLHYLLIFSGAQTAAMASKMLPIRPGTSAIRSLSKRRPSCSQPFSTTAPTTAASPYRKTQKAPSEQTRRPATTAAAPAPQSRPTPSPAFNLDFRNEPSPLVNRQVPELDESFVGLSGGEIFHEMMLRHGVKHICT